MVYEIETKDLPAQNVVTIRIQTIPRGIGQAFGELLPELADHLEQQGAEPTGPSFGIFHEYTSGSVDMEAGFPVASPLRDEGRIGSRELPAATFAVTWHEGAYSSIGQAHDALREWMAAQGKQATGPAWEVYWTGPETTSDSSRWRTEVCYPIS